ncbi:MAG: response regulator transcription factor [Bacteroidota bacterium]
MKRRVFLVEDHPITREGFRAVIDRTPDLEVVGEAADGPSALDGIAASAPDIVVLDVMIDGSDGIEVTKQLRSIHADLPILVVSGLSEGVYGERALRAGAQGYLMKQEPPDRFLDAIRTVLSGHIALSPALRERLVDSYLTASGSAASAVDDLTDRELEVFRQFGHGLTTAEVAEAIMVSPKTVETHRVHIKQKLGIRTTNEFVQRAALWVAREGGATGADDAA